MTSTRDLKDQGTEDQHELERLRAEVAAWRARFDRGEKRDVAFTNSEGEVEPLYSALDREDESLGQLPP